MKKVSDSSVGWCFLGMVWFVVWSVMVGGMVLGGYNVIAGSVLIVITGAMLLVGGWRLSR